MEITYICTIGTGTAGANSCLAQGVVNAVRLRNPQTCILVPSSSEASHAIAEMIEMELSDTPAIQIHRDRCLSQHDNLRQCRKEMRDLLRELKQRDPESTLVLNPTSGTKQMTTGAVLAGVDEGLENIEYITGERVDGVVRTGSETITVISGRHIQGEAAARQARHLLNHGAYQGAELILHPYLDLFPESHALSVTLGYWHRFAYTKALNAAKGNSPCLRAIRQQLQRLRDSDSLSLERAADMLQFSRRSLDFGQVEEALAALYRLVELLAKLRLQELGIPPQDYYVENLLHHPSLSIDHVLKAKIQFMGNNSTQPILLGLRMSLDLLKNTHFTLSNDLFPDNQCQAWQILQERNQTRYGHGNSFVDKRHVDLLFAKLISAIQSQWPAFEKLYNALAFPAMNPIIDEEIDHV